jgi:hypothetical protein
LTLLVVIDRFPFVIVAKCWSAVVCQPAAR